MMTNKIYFFLWEFTLKSSAVPRGKKCFSSWSPIWPPWRYVQTTNTEKNQENELKLNYIKLLPYKLKLGKWTIDNVPHRVALKTVETLYKTSCINVTIAFLLTDPSTAIFFCKSTAIICQHALKNWTFVTFEHWHFLQSYVIELGGRLPKTENKRIRRISGVRRSRGRLRNLRSSRLRENFWKSIQLTNKTVISKVVTYEKWESSLYY